MGQALAPGLDYLVGCEYNAAADQLWLLAGNNAGSVGFFPVLEPPPALEPPQAQQAADSEEALIARPPPPQPRPLFGQPQGVLAGGAHSDVVRSVLWPGAAGSMCLSGGEDSRICVWSLALQAAAGPQQQQQQQGHAKEQEQQQERGVKGNGVMRKHQHSQQHQQPHHPRRAAPY